MSNLLTSVIAIRGANHEVSEIDGKTMREIRRRLKETPELVEAYIVWRCAVDPKYATEDAAAAEPQAVLKAISEEAFRLSALETDGGKNG
jgi:hypothetical protein